MFKSHILFDDQLTRLRSSPGAMIPVMHVPFGIANRRGLQVA